MTPRLPTTPPAVAAPDVPTVSPLEWCLVIGAALAGLALRAWHLSDAGLTHFDEGVYAFTGMGVADAAQPRRLFPDQQKFSPPVYFLLVALFNVLGVAPDRSPLVVNVVMGTLTIPAAWWLVRRWFGPMAAASVAWLVALSEFHVLMSRSGLTDVAFALTFLLALAGVLHALDRGTRAAELGAGLLVGLAWNTKYHGWFALVIGAMVIAGRRYLQRAGDGWFRRAIRTWLTISVVAAICYIPWSLFIQAQPGSSTGWASYFATMLRLDWFGNLWQQVQQQTYLEGPWSRASVPVAMLAAHLVAMRSGRGYAWWSFPVAGAFALVLGSSGVALVLSGVVLWRSWRSGMSFPAWVLGALVVLWVVMAPLYHPYFRLILPFTLGTFALAGAAFALAPERSRSARVLPSTIAGLAASALVIVAARRLPDPSDPWRPTRGLPAAARAIAARMPAGAPVSVLGEPALAFYLHREGHPSFERSSMEAFDHFTEPRFLVAGAYLRRAPLLRARFDARRERFTLIERFSIDVPSDLRLLDDFYPDSARQWIVRPDSTYDLLLFRYMPPSAARP